MNTYVYKGFPLCLNLWATFWTKWPKTAWKLQNTKSTFFWQNSMKTFEMARAGGAYFGVIGRIHHGVPKPGYDTVR